MTEIQFLQELVAKFPVAHMILVILGSLVVIGQGIVVMTPSQADDHAWERIKGIPVLGKFIQALTAFAPFVKK